MSKALVQFNGRDATLVNISRSGALLRLGDSLPVGSEGTLTLSHRSTTIEIGGEVVRQRAGWTSPAPTDDREVSIRFVTPGPPQVAALLRQLIAHP